MGCGGSVAHLKSKMKIYMLDIIRRSEKEIQIVKKVKNEITLEPEKTVMNYMKENPKFDSLFSDPDTINECIFFLYYRNNKSKKVFNSKQVEFINPFNENSEEKNRQLKKVFVLPGRILTKFNLTQNDILKETDREHHIANIIIPNEEENIDIIGGNDELTDDEVYGKEQGDHIEVNKDLINQDRVISILDKLKTGEVSSFLIQRNKFENLNSFAEIIQELIRNKHLKSFTFSNNLNPSGFEKGWKLITQLFRENNNIRHINLHCGNLYDKFLVEMFGDALIGKRIRFLDLSSNFISHSGAKYIADWLKFNKTLKVLLLQRNASSQFMATGCEVIIKSLLKHKNITKLDFSHMDLTGIGKPLAELIKVSQSLRDLRIKSVRMNLNDYKAICPPLCENKIITTLDISDNPTGIASSLDYLASVITNNKFIINICLDKLDNSLEVEKFETLFDALKVNETIEQYSFTKNPQLKLRQLLPLFVKKKHIKALACGDKDGKLSKEDEKAIEEFMKEREDVELTVYKI